MKLIGWMRRLFRRPDMPFDVVDVERAIGYRFHDPAFLFKSLKHRSYSQAVDGTIRKSNERLEFLGDSVLSLVVSHYLFKTYPDYQEGDLTKLKSSLVNRHAAMIAGRRVGLNRFILLNESEEHAGGRNRTSIIADAFEAVIGGIYLDGGYGAAESFIYRTILDDSDRYLEDSGENYKSILLEYIQGTRQGHPLYRTIDESGPDHAKIFTVTVSLNGEVIGTGTGKSKKAAQQLAAKQGIEILTRENTSEVPTEQSEE